MTAAGQRVKRRQDREETRRQILAAADAFLRERPFRELSVDALMAQTGHTRTVFYRHFDDISALVLALMEQVGGELVQVAQAWAAADHTGPSEARERLGALVDFHVRHGALVLAVVQATHHDPAVEAAYRGLMDAFIAITAGAIQTRIDAGDVADMDAQEIARALVWMLNGYLGDTVDAGREVDPERVLETLWTVWTRTLFPAR